MLYYKSSKIENFWKSNFYDYPKYNFDNLYDDSPTSLHYYYKRYFIIEYFKYVYFWLHHEIVYVISQWNTWLIALMCYKLCINNI